MLEQTVSMSRYQTITFRCRKEVYDRLELFAQKHGIDRTSAIKLALHYYLNLKLLSPQEEPQDAPEEGTREETRA